MDLRGWYFLFLPDEGVLSFSRNKKFPIPVAQSPRLLPSVSSHELVYPFSLDEEEEEGFVVNGERGARVPKDVLVGFKDPFERG